MPRYSIIVPVYNVAPYLRECLDSILAQDSPSEYEVILVDDGSTDSSGTICDEYAEIHSRIKVTHQTNAGVGAARNVGIAAALGEYLLFMDSDDYWEKAAISTLDFFLEHRPDMVQMCAESFDESGVTKKLSPDLFPAKDGEKGKDYLNRLFAIGKMPLYGSYYYLYRKDFLNESGIRFDERLQVNEDLDFVMKSLAAAQKLFGTDFTAYHYRLHLQSVTHSITADKIMMELTTHAKWFRKYPVSALADEFAMCSIGIALINSPEERKMISDYLAENADIIRCVKDFRAKIARFLFSLFGPYGGAIAFLKMVDIKHFLHRWRRTRF